MFKSNQGITVSANDIYTANVRNHVRILTDSSITPEYKHALVTEDLDINSSDGVTFSATVSRSPSGNVLFNTVKILVSPVYTPNPTTGQISLNTFLTPLLATATVLDYNPSYCATSTLDIPDSLSLSGAEDSKTFNSVLSDSNRVVTFPLEVEAFVKVIRDFIIVELDRLKNTRDITTGAFTSECYKVIKKYFESAAFYNKLLSVFKGSGYKTFTPLYSVKVRVSYLSIATV